MTKQRVESTAKSGQEGREVVRARDQRASANQDDVLRVAMARLPICIDAGLASGDDRHSLIENNQDAAEEYAEVSLELLALLSPHGTTQHWDDDEENCGEFDHDHKTRRLSMLARMGLAEISDTCKTPSREQPYLSSPTQHMSQFEPSPTHSEHGSESDLVSPVALPESPWDLAYQRANLSLEDCDTCSTETAGLSDTPEEPEHNNSLRIKGCEATSLRFSRQGSRVPCSPDPHVRTPGKSSTRHQATPSESKPKARHGGIYSLLLKNKPREQEPPLLDEISGLLDHEGVRSGVRLWPRDDCILPSPTPHSITKRSSPPSIAKFQHGGIYGVLRRNSQAEE